ncbi:DUF302 domain-containing protein [Hydrogenimonas sp.]
MKKLLGLILLALALQAENGMISYKSRFSVDETTKRLVQVLREKGVTLFKVIDHAEGAASAGMKLRPMKLVIFGNPKMGTPFMQCSPTMGLDLPQKMLVYENNASEVMITYNSPNYLFWRHNVDANCSAPLQKKMGVVLQKFAKYAAGLGR